MDANYEHHLGSVFPDTTWQVEKTIQGSTNATLRATKLTGATGPSSVILKHAAPFFEDDDDGHVQPFSIKRQVGWNLSRLETAQANSVSALKQP